VRCIIHTDGTASGVWRSASPTSKFTGATTASQTQNARSNSVVPPAVHAADVPRCRTRYVRIAAATIEPT
jgi:hypothetical protein